MTVVPVKAGETALLRFINAALSHELFITIAQHKMAVVATDASYTKPFTTLVLMIAPGQTTNMLVTMDQAPTRYYIATRAYVSGQNMAFDTTTKAVLEYDYGCASEFDPKIQLAFPALPAFNDTATATAFAAGIKSPNRVKIHENVDEYLFFTSVSACSTASRANFARAPTYNNRFTASMNNVSFVFPKTDSLLHAP